MFLLCSASSAPAATYTVTRTDDPIPDACLPGDCSLREALLASNSTPAVDDSVVIPASAAPYRVLYEELTLPVSDEVWIRGEGANRTVVEGDGKAVLFSVDSPAVVIAGITMRNGDGAIQNNGDLALWDVSIEGNESAVRGGGVQSNGILRIESSFIGFNRSTAGAGGGIQANAPVTLVNSTLAWNSSSGNGGINGNAGVNVFSSAVVFNRSDGSTGAGVGGMALTVRDSIFAGNANTAGTFNCSSFMGVTSLGGNVSDDATCGTGGSNRPNVNPLLGTLALHGGTTPLYDLLPGSPAIDAASGCEPEDQRGVARPQGAACDSGPYEFVPAAPGDKEFFMSVGKKLRLGKKAILAKLTCPASEISPPCRGKIVFPKILLGLGRRGGVVMPLIARYARARFTIWAGRTKVVNERMPKGTANSLREAQKPQKILAFVYAEDGAGNRWGIKKRAPLIRR